MLLAALCFLGTPQLVAGERPAFDSPLLVVLLDEEPSAINTPAIGASASAHVRSLIALLPMGMALVDRDGRFVHMNDAFVRAARINTATPPLPGRRGEQILADREAS